MARASLFLAMGGLVQASPQPFVPACIARECAAEARALGGDAYVQAFGTCASNNFGPCGPQAWGCLGDSACRSVVSCGPKVLETCKADIWRVLTNPKEREMVSCMMQCNKNGTIKPLCVAWKCGRAAVGCLEDATCRHAAECLPKAQLACSKDGFECLFGHSGVCRENLKCLGHGVESCGAPALNLLTDTKIADFVSCAGSRCPRPAEAQMPVPKAVAGFADGSAPATTAEQLLCMATKCGSDTVKLLEDEDTKELLRCANEGNLTQLCSSVWQCLGDSKCSEAVHCWSQPLQACQDDVWHLLTDPAQRQRLASNVACLRDCKKAHAGDGVAAGFCVLDKCSEDLLACKADASCWKAVQCLPRTAEDCAMPSLDAYVHQPLFAGSVKCLGRGFESCGRRAVEMLRDQNVARAVSCAAQCTRTPGTAQPDFVV